MVLMEACKVTQQLGERLGWPLSVSVNVSPKQFADERIIGDVRQALESSGLDPALLILEITGGMFLSNAIETGEILTHLLELGVALAMDDCGQGYSSYSYLRTHPFCYFDIVQVFI